MHIFIIYTVFSTLCIQSSLIPYTRTKAIRRHHIQRLYPRFHRIRTIHTEADIHIIEYVIAQTDLLFKEVPGYKKVVENVYTSFNGFLSHTSKGPLYELQVALDFHSRGHTICAFEKTYKNEKINCERELDIITNLCAIECKNIHWHLAEHSPKILRKIQQQIYDQKALVDSGTIGVPHYILCSKNEIPLTCRNWLEEQGVFYFIYSPERSVY